MLKINETLSVKVTCHFEIFGDDKDLVRQSRIS